MNREISYQKRFETHEKIVYYQTFLEGAPKACVILAVFVAL